MPVIATLRLSPAMTKWRYVTEVTDNAPSQNQNEEKGRSESLCCGNPEFRVKPLEGSATLESQRRDQPVERYN